MHSAIARTAAARDVQNLRPYQRILASLCSACTQSFARCCQEMLGFVPPDPAHTMLDVIDAWTDRRPD